MTFFEAFKSEVCPPSLGGAKTSTNTTRQLTGGKEVEAAFPEALKGPVLRRVQFQTTSRLDNMVDTLFQEFKNDFYPGEEVTVAGDGGERVHGLVRDKTSVGPRILPDGTPCPPMSRYLVSLKGGKSEIYVKDEDVARDRGVFTKAMLRSFIKRTTIREAWNGAPWLVKHDYAAKYHIDTRIPPHLRYDTKREERRQLQAQKRQSQSQDLSSNGHNGVDSGPVRLPELKPAPKSHKGKQNLAIHDGKPPMGEQKAVPKEPTPPPPPPPPKYPIEDLDLPPQPSLPPRPALQFMCKDPPYDGHVDDWRTEKIEMSSVGPLLETWDTLNVYCEVFKLDSFTFDDYVEAMLVASEQVPVQLFDEIHCSVLKVLVDSEKDGGKVRITLPEIEEEEDSDEEEDEEEDDEGSREATPEPDPKPTGRATRSSLAKLEAERLAAAAKEEELQAELETRHRAEELLEDYSWIDHLRRRDFANGGWEMMVVGLLHQLSKDPRKEEQCEELLLQLVPPDVAPSVESVRQAYAELDFNYRVKVLQIICMLTMETKSVRGYMEECSETMTKYRKDKIEWQRRRKQA